MVATLSPGGEHVRWGREQAGTEKNGRNVCRGKSSVFCLPGVPVSPAPAWRVPLPSSVLFVVYLLLEGRRDRFQ